MCSSFLRARVTFIIRKGTSLDFLPSRIFNDHGPRIVWAGTLPPPPSRLERGSGAPAGGEPGPGASPAVPTHPGLLAEGCACPPLYSSAVRSSSSSLLTSPSVGIREPGVRGETQDHWSQAWEGQGGPQRRTRNSMGQGARDGDLAPGSAGLAGVCDEPSTSRQGGQQGDPQQAPVISTTPGGWDTRKGQKGDKDAGASRREE